MLGEMIGARNFFGFRSLTIKGKSFIILFEDALVFNLDDGQAELAMALKGVARWNPYGREKKHWIQLPEQHSAEWDSYLTRAAEKILTILGEGK